MGKVYDITILYSEEDNVSDFHEDKGWIKNFVHYLQVFLSQLIGRNIQFTMVSESNVDEENDINSPVLLIAISASSLKLTNYRFKIQQIVNKIYHATGNNKIAIFKVVKRPFFGEGFSNEFEKILPHNFYHINPSNGKIEDISCTPGSTHEKIFWMKLIDLAHDLAPHFTEHKALVAKGTIYLAETSIELVAEREMIRRELLRNGFVVLPNETLPETLHELELSIKKDLAKSDISVHIIGHHYGTPVSGSDKSLIDLQNLYASQYSATNSAVDHNGRPAFKRIIWLNEGNNPLEKQQEQFIRNLKRDAEALREAEVLQTSFEEFKLTIVKHLLNGFIQTKKIKNINGEIKTYADHKTNGKKIYLIYDLIDKEESMVVIQYLQDSGFEVLTPKFEANLISNKNTHINNLLTADASIIFSSKSNLNWLKIKYLDVLKAPGLGKAKAFQAKAIYLAPGVHIKDNQFILDDTHIFESNGTLVPETLSPLLTQIIKTR